MLKYLHIENIAVIESTDIDFTKGFNVLTGETGAGKSIIIDSINAVMGERTSKELIRSGCNKAEVSAVFGDIGDTALNVIKENGFDIDDEGNLLISRQLTSSGSTIKINGKPATAGVLKLISKGLINIHGQHDNQGLLQPENHYLYIDLLAENSDILARYNEEFKHLNSVRRQIAMLETDEDEKRRKRELLTYQIEELEKANIKVGEQETLKSKLEIARNSQRIRATLSEIQLYLNGTDDTDGAVSMLANAQKKLISLGSGFDATAQKLANVIAQAEDIGFDIRNFAESDEFSNINSEEISERLDKLYSLMLKYGNSEQSMLDYLDGARIELEGISLSERKINELSDELDISTERLIKLGEELTSSRVRAADKFSKDVTQTLAYLDMPDVAFEVKMDKGRYSKVGCDTVEFLIRTNVGETLKPLQKIASGGELSRIMLAIKSVLAKKDEVDTLIFDEIDTGISGRAAGKVAVQLKKVSESRQVICVTHLSQIAAFADNHLLISKSSENGRTYTQVERLNYNDRINEIARIMSGTDITENLYNSAKELLDRSSKNGNL